MTIIGSRIGFPGFLIASLLCAFVTGPAAFAVDTDGDGVADGLDCRPIDATTWTVPTEAKTLRLAGGASTTFQWNAPDSPGGTALLYDVIRSTSPSNFSSATCLVSNAASTAPAVIDSATPSPIFYYLVRSKTACGSTLGANSAAVPRTGADCSTANGGSCSIGATCTGGWCCGGSCSDLTTDVNNCSACGVACTNQAGTTACLAAACSPTCAPTWGDCFGGPNDGCETQLVTPTHCGGCGIVCPGYNQPNDNVFCANDMTCIFSCMGENYDVNSDPANGCEVADSPTGNHNQAAAVSQGSRSCIDTDTFSFGGKIVSDARVHETPSITGFNTTSGSAPDWMSLSATGGFCNNDLSISFQVSGSVAPTCYRLSVITNGTSTFACQTDAAGTCSISQASGAYVDNSTIYFRAEKTCSTATRESVNYTISGHL